MSDERDPLLEEMGATLSVQPSTAFVARVRADVASERMRWPWRAHLLVAVPFVLSMALAGAVWLNREASPAPSMPAVMMAEVSTLATTASTPTAAQTKPARVTSRRVAPARVNPSREPEVLVPSDQAEGLRLWLAYVREGRAVLPPDQRVADVDREAGELPPLPEITGIEVPAVRIEPLPGAEGQNAGELDD